MTRRSSLRQLVVLSTLAAASALATAQTLTQTDLHRDAATRNTGGDAFMLKYARAFYCNLADDNNAIVIEARGWNNTTGTGANAIYRIPLTQIFDDVWFVGNHYVGQYLIKTADGLVQVDSGNNANEFATFNYPAMQALGLGASYPLKSIFLTHGHFDHDGGAKWALDNLGARSFLGSADAAGKIYGPNPINSGDLSMREMSVGGKTFWVLPTPGHTPGSTSAVLEVKDWGQTRRVLINGGQSMTNSIPQVAQYLDSIERTYAMADVLQVDGVMTPHIYWDGEGQKLREILASGRSNPSQHIYGHDAVMRQLAVARECSAAWLTRLDSTVVLPVWRYNTIEFVSGRPPHDDDDDRQAGRGRREDDDGPSPNHVAARLSNGWGPMVGQLVTFSVVESGASCKARTRADGVARCELHGSHHHGQRPHSYHLTARFAGSEDAGFVDLAAETSALLCSAGRCKAH